MPNATGAKRGAWNHGNALFREEAFGEDLIGEAG
jgi:hypothetical protein